MIQFANKYTRSLVRSMWQSVFGDEDRYMDLIFETKYKDENTLIYFEDNIPVASLQMFPYTIRFYGQPVFFYYLGGLCTLPQYRGRGYMSQLILKSFHVMLERKISLSVLVPAESSLFQYYDRYGYVQTFDKGGQSIDLKSIVPKYHADKSEAFELFDTYLQQEDFIVMKTSDDFRIIVEEYLQSNCPAKYNLAAMSRIIDALPLLEIYAQKNATQSFTIKVADYQLDSHKTYQIQDGLVKLIETSVSDLEVDIKLLTQLLFGYKTQELAPEYIKYFGEHSPIINLMLE